MTDPFAEPTRFDEFWEQWGLQVKWGAAVVGLALVATFAAIGFTPGGLAPRSTHPVAVVAVLVPLLVLLAYWAVEGDRRLLFIVMVGLIGKAIGTFLRVELTADAGDAQFYNRTGTRISELLFDGTLVENDPRISTRGAGTNNLVMAVGRLYYLLGPNINIGFIVFSSLSFTGSLLVFRAASEAVPGIDRARYAMLLFWLPSMLFWPSTLGKDTWMVAGIGLTVLGVARLSLRPAPAPIAMTGLGIVMTGWIRPHVAALLALCIVISIVWPEFRRRSSGRVRRLVLAGAGIAVLIVVLGEVQRFFGTDGIDLGAVLDETAATTSQGGSEFTARRATDPIGLLLGIPSVLLRPFPHETQTVLQLATSFEGVGVLVLTAFSWPRIRSAPRMFMRNPLVRFAIVYFFGFVVSFSVVSNFGILARQRVQVWPLFLMLLCLPKASRRRLGSARAPRVNPSTGQEVGAQSEP